ncbi:hypothetical protein [Clostridium cylindrosporum]|uniref:Uncharacterized protein n=1 Tax=Clostridium cylindrosporum DSM 605 TaxID=1121307 RepID=A0A0J8FZA9_CLOCY|nr:hypothetical protein [Clostridium cylindrosporum]KMT20946.1 hypothetical protein CLCY_1c01800 [Clostridium cylindrosporum DSM 605]
MKEHSTDNNSKSTIIRVIKIVGEESEKEENSKARAILSIEGSLINILSKKLQVYLNDNQLSGGIMDISTSEFEFELVQKNDKHDEDEEVKAAASHMLSFIEFLREDYNVDIENNFDGLEVTADELAKLLKTT